MSRADRGCFGASLRKMIDRGFACALCLCTVQCHAAHLSRAVKSFYASQWDGMCIGLMSFYLPKEE